MPDNSLTHRLHQARDLLAAIECQVGEPAGLLGSIEGELADLEERAPDLTEDATPETPLTQEQIDIASVKMLLTVQEAAALLSVSTSVVRDMADRGEFPVCKLGRAVRIPTKQLQEHIEAVRAGEGEG